jgi:hypothetical protein
MFDPLVLSDTKDMYANTETRCGGMAKTFTNTQTERQGPSAGDVWPWLEHTVTQSLLPLSPSSACAPHKTTSPSSFPDPAGIQLLNCRAAMRALAVASPVAASAQPRRRCLIAGSSCYHSTCLAAFQFLLQSASFCLDNLISYGHGAILYI